MRAGTKNHTGSTPKALAGGKGLKCKKGEERGQPLPADAAPQPRSSQREPPRPGAAGQAHGVGRSLHPWTMRTIVSQPK